MSAQTLAPNATSVPDAPEPPRGPRKEAGPAWLFIAPFGIFFVLFLIWPVIYMFITSMFDTTLVRPGFGSFVGFANYAEMLSRADFWEALWHTIQFTIYTVPPLVVLAFVFAVLANRVGRGQWFFRLAFFVPFILPSAAIALIWNFIFTPTTGLWNSFQTLLGNEDPSPVLGTPDLAMIGIAKSATSAASSTRWPRTSMPARPWRGGRVTCTAPPSTGRRPAASVRVSARRRPPAR